MMNATTMRARPTEFAVELEAEHARAFVQRIRDAYAARLDGDGHPIHRITDTPEGFRVDDHRIRAVEMSGTFGSGYGTITIIIQATDGPAAIRASEKRLEKLGVL